MWLSQGCLPSASRNAALQRVIPGATGRVNDPSGHFFLFNSEVRRGLRPYRVTTFTTIACSQLASGAPHETQLQMSSSRASSSKVAHTGSSTPVHGHERRTQQWVLEGQRFESTPLRLCRAEGWGRGMGHSPHGGAGAHGGRHERAGGARGSAARAARVSCATLGSRAGQGRFDLRRHDGRQGRGRRAKNRSARGSVRGFGGLIRGWACGHSPSAYSSSGARPRGGLEGQAGSSFSVALS